jgi:hypothetical protein
MSYETLTPTIPEPSYGSQPHPRCNRPPFIDSTHFIDVVLPQERRPLWSAWVCTAPMFAHIRRNLAEQNADWLIVRLGEGRLFLLCAAPERPCRILVSLSREQAVEQARCWLRHRRASEIQSSGGAWELPLFKEAK